MGCFTGASCFGTRKRSKTRRSSTTATLIEDQNMCHEREISEVLGCLYSSTGTGTGTDDEQVRIMTVEIIKNDAAELEKELKRYNERKKVAYHADMMMNPLTHLGMGKQTTIEIPILIPNSIQVEEKSVPPKSKDDEVKVDAADSSASSSLFTYPTTHRYHNCSTSDDESEVTGFQKSDLADEGYGEIADTIDKGNCNHQGCPFDGENVGIVDSIGDGENNREGRPFDSESVDIDCIGIGTTTDREGGLSVEAESSESLFSLSIDSKKKILAAEIGEKEVSSPFKLSTIDMNLQNTTSRGQCIHPVLNPIENMSQWRPLEEKTISSLKNKDQEKENLFQQELKPPHIEESIFKNSKHHSMRQTRKEDENAVDTSLSSWLMVSGKSRTNENSPVSVGNSSKRTNSSSSRSFDDRPILGALTLDKLKQQSRFSAPRHSPSHSPENMPIIGTVGSYWMHTGQCIELKNSSRKTSSKSSGQCIELNSSIPSRKTSINQTITSAMHRSKLK